MILTFYMCTLKQIHINFLVYYKKLSIKLATVLHALKKSYLWQETEMDLWWDQGIPQHWPGLQQSWPPVLLAALKWETSLFHPVFQDISIFLYVHVFQNSGIYHRAAPLKQGRTAQLSRSCWSLPLLSWKGEWTSFKEICKQSFAQMSLRWP